MDSFALHSIDQGLCPGGQQGAQIWATGYAGTRNKTCSRTLGFGAIQGDLEASPDCSEIPVWKPWLESEDLNYPFVASLRARNYDRWPNARSTVDTRDGTWFFRIKSEKRLQGFSLEQGCYVCCRFSSPLY